MRLMNESREVRRTVLPHSKHYTCECKFENKQKWLTAWNIKEITGNDFCVIWPVI